MSPFLKVVLAIRRRPDARSWSVVTEGTMFHADAFWCGSALVLGGKGNKKNKVSNRVYTKQNSLEERHGTD